MSDNTHTTPLDHTYWRFNLEGTERCDSPFSTYTGGCFHYCPLPWYLGTVVTVKYHTCICSCDDVIKTPNYLSDISLASSHESFPHCSVSKSSNSITFPNYTLDLYHLSKTVQRSYFPTIHLINLLLSYSPNLLS
jgi:predicted membrane-bound mannosyltransferase